MSLRQKYGPMCTALIIGVRPDGEDLRLSRPRLRRVDVARRQGDPVMLPNRPIVRKEDLVRRDDLLALEVRHRAHPSRQAATTGDGCTKTGLTV